MVPHCNISQSSSRIPQVPLISKKSKNFQIKKWIFKTFLSLWLNVTFKIHYLDFKGSKTELSLMVRLTIKLKSENLGKGGPR
jgi:hypothetical protein